MKHSATRALENLKALEPTQQERIQQALKEMYETRIHAQAHVLQIQSAAHHGDSHIKETS